MEPQPATTTSMLHRRLLSQLFLNLNPCQGIARPRQLQRRYEEEDDELILIGIAENDLVVKKFPENDLVVKKFPENDFLCRYGSAEEARNHLPPNKVWGDRTEDEWNNLVHWFSNPNGWRKSPEGHFEGLIVTWRKDALEAGEWGFKTKKPRYEEHARSGEEVTGGWLSTSREARFLRISDAISREEAGSDIEAKRFKRLELLRKQSR
ncbi:hypothetical protein Tco_0276727 [Tanacetum coccineum]